MTDNTDPTIDNDSDVDEDTAADSDRDERHREKRLGPLGEPSENSDKPPSYNDEGQ